MCLLMQDWLLSSWHPFWRATIVAINLYATAHTVLNKRDTHAAIGWVGLIWFTPGVGAVLYYLFGVNRIKETEVAVG